MIKSWINWSLEIASCVQAADDDRLRDVANLFRQTKLVITAGNGGSHALASHAAQALMKPSYEAGGGVAAICLSDAVPTLTAHANDGGWASALAQLVQPFIERRSGSTPQTCALWIFSSSGKSENLVRLAQEALAYSCPVVAFTGFDGEPLKRMATISVHVDNFDYEVVEPVHDALLHRVQAHLRHRE